MPIAKIASLQKLISSLTKAEKRHFILFVNRLESNRERLFVRLFHLLDKRSDLEDSYFLKTLKISKSQFINTKRHLYSQILKSLRLLHEQADPILSARQRLDYATLLYKRGQYHESLSLLNSIKHASSQIDNIVSLEVAEFQKKIESRHITRSRGTKSRIENIVSTSVYKQALIAVETQMSNISLEVQGLYIKWGFARDERDALMYQVYFQSQLPDYNRVRISPIAAVLWHQAYVWYHYMRLDFHFSYKHAVLWVKKMEQQIDSETLDVDLCMRGYHYILTNCFYLKRNDRFQFWLDKFRSFRKIYFKSFNKTSLLLDFSYYDNAELNSKIFNKRYSKFETYAQELEQKMERLSDSLDIHRILIFQYKLGIAYSYKGDYEKAIEYFNKVLESQDQQLRTDLFSYARLVHLMCHYKINNFTLVLNLLPSIKSTFEVNMRLNPVVELMISFLRKGSKAMNFGVNELVASTSEKIKYYQTQPFAKVAFIYYDFLEWLSKDTT